MEILLLIGPNICLFISSISLRVVSPSARGLDEKKRRREQVQKLPAMWKCD